MHALPTPFVDLLAGIWWRALVALWILVLAATASLVVTDAPSVVVAIVMGGAAVMIAATTVAGPLSAAVQATAEPAPGGAAGWGKVTAVALESPEQLRLPGTDTGTGSEIREAHRIAFWMRMRHRAQMPELGKEDALLDALLDLDEEVSIGDRGGLSLVMALYRHSAVATALCTNPLLDDLGPQQSELEDLIVARAARSFFQGRYASRVVVEDQGNVMDDLPAPDES